MSIIVPHPEKRAKRGEDAAFTLDSGFGVFDGVGGWVLEDIDAGLYSKGLSQHCRTAISTDQPFKHRPAKDILTDAVDAVDEQGSSTALVGVLRQPKPNTYMLNVCNVGDCQALIIRDGVVVFRTQEQQHTFNMPYQLQYDLRDDLSQADVRDVRVRDGDVLVAASDGLWDNVHEADVISTVSRHAKVWSCTAPSVRVKKDKGLLERKAFSVKMSKSRAAGDSVFRYERLNDLAFDLAGMACITAHNTHALSPFAQKAMREGLYAPGGKLDDITVVVALVRRTGNSYHAMYQTDCGIPYEMPSAARPRSSSAGDDDDDDDESDNVSEDAED